MLVRFCRRVAKRDLLKKKRQLNEKESTKDVNLFKDLMKANLNFFKLIKTDDRDAAAGTEREISSSSTERIYIPIK